ncbi:MAG: M48 family metalloprotease [Pseudobdellovibrionaceae bacterium]|nr:M48 family metalloprotease [Bdellovibrionales bacterium]USN47543.1 MAG: M48 family metalloprotease [Pseudobdellovibrionaceae bacterium]
MGRLIALIILLVSFQTYTKKAEAKLSFWQETALSFDDYLRDTIQPAAQKMYEDYYDRWGKDIGNQFLATIRSVSSFVKETSSYSYKYWSNRYPETFSDLERVPTPIKRSYEKFILTLWRSLNTVEQATAHLPNEYKDASEFAVLVINAIKNAKQHPQQPQLDALLRQLRPHAADPEMRDCYQVQVIELGFNNAFNIGCNIFVTEKMVKELPDEQLLAVLAHEISHGDQGHSVESIFSLATSTGAHVSQLIMDELLWMFTGDQTQRLQRVLGSGNMPVILDAFGEKAPAQEMEADHFGACLLKRAGFPQEWMQDALLALHKVSRETYDQMSSDFDDDVNGENVRKYPSLKKRMDAAVCL